MFNITGSAIFENIKFSGVNGLAKSKRSTYDVSVVPAILCQVKIEPTG
jgi:hypothetical protein